MKTKENSLFCLRSNTRQGQVKPIKLPLDRSKSEQGGSERVLNHKKLEKRSPSIPVFCGWSGWPRFRSRSHNEKLYSPYSPPSSVVPPFPAACPFARLSAPFFSSPSPLSSLRAQRRGGSPAASRGALHAARHALWNERATILAEKLRTRETDAIRTPTTTLPGGYAAKHRGSRRRRLLPRSIASVLEHGCAHTLRLLSISERERLEIYVTRALPANVPR